MASGLILRLTHSGLTSARVLIADVDDGSDKSTVPRPGAVYVPVGGSVDLTFTSSVANSFEAGNIRSFVDDGLITTRLVPGTELAADVVGTHWTLNFIGKGVGASKTTTVRDGPVLAEEFGVGDEIFCHWAIPPHIDRTKDLTLTAHCYLNATEVGKVVSFQADVGASDSFPVNTILQSVTDVDRPVNAQFVDFHVQITITGTTVMPGGNEDALQINLKRIASSNDPTAEVRVHLVEIIAQV